MRINLGSRLAAVASMVIPGKPVADIGTDHAYLPIFLVVNGIAPTVIASDKAPAPLDNSRQLVELLSLDKSIDMRLGDGLQVLSAGEAATVCIAGMGGAAIKEILTESPLVLEATERLVLQPQRNISAVRRYLAQNGWRICAEDIAFDKGFYYMVMAAEKGSMTLTDAEAEYGPLLLKNGHPFLAPYLRLKLTDIESLLERLNDRPGKEAAARLKVLSCQADNIRQLLATLPAFRD